MTGDVFLIFEDALARRLRLAVRLLLIAAGMETTTAWQTIE